MVSLKKHMIFKHPDAVKEGKLPQKGTRKGNRGKSVEELQKMLSSKCNICREMFNSANALKYHKAKVHGSLAKLSCAECKFTCTQQRYLTEHMKRHMEVKKKCLYCEKEFAHNKTKNRHMRKVHGWKG